MFFTFLPLFVLMLWAVLLLSIVHHSFVASRHGGRGRRPRSGRSGQRQLLQQCVRLPPRPEHAHAYEHTTRAKAFTQWRHAKPVSRGSRGSRGSSSKSSSSSGKSSSSSSSSSSKSSKCSSSKKTSRTSSKRAARPATANATAARAARAAAAAAGARAESASAPQHQHRRISISIVSRNPWRAAGWER
jgi:hypothetical protein